MLACGEDGELADPIISLYDSTGAAIATNSDWTSDTNAYVLINVGLDLSQPRESALYRVLDPGAYRVTMSGVGNTTGVGLIEVYDGDEAIDGFRLITRAWPIFPRRRQFAKCPRSQFIKAVYNHQEVDADMTGTIIFGVINGKPHLRIFLNQDEEHLKKGDDFIAPQEVYPWNVSHNSSYYFRGWNGSARIQMQTDATGKLLHSTLIRIASRPPCG